MCSATLCIWEESEENLATTLRADNQVSPKRQRQSSRKNFTGIRSILEPWAELQPAPLSCQQIMFPSWKNFTVENVRRPFGMMTLRDFWQDLRDKEISFYFQRTLHIRSEAVAIRFMPKMLECKSESNLDDETKEAPSQHEEPSESHEAHGEALETAATFTMKLNGMTLSVKMTISSSSSSSGGEWKECFENLPRIISRRSAPGSSSEH